VPILVNLSPRALRAGAETLVLQDKERGEFKVNRRAFTDDAVPELERGLIFSIRDVVPGDTFHARQTRSKRAVLDIDALRPQGKLSIIL
jgi:hypothetical protein